MWNDVSGHPWSSRLCLCDCVFIFNLRKLPTYPFEGSSHRSSSMYVHQNETWAHLLGRVAQIFYTIICTHIFYILECSNGAISLGLECGTPGVPKRLYTLGLEMSSKYDLNMIGPDRQWVIESSVLRNPLLKVSNQTYFLKKITHHTK